MATKKQCRCMNSERCEVMTVSAEQVCLNCKKKCEGEPGRKLARKSAAK